MKNLRKILSVCAFLFVAVCVINSVYGISVPSADSIKGDDIDSVSNLAKDIWATVATILQILAVAAVVVAGVRYMFASADAKADIKKQTVILIVGAVLVFGATTILQFVSGLADSALGTTVQ